jgi:adenine-specific DNA-methyltransferase
MTQAGTAHKQRERFIQLLRELFQLNQPDLDFGLYRIMHAKSAEIEAFLTDDLLAVIAATFGGSAQVAIDAAHASYERELATAIEYGAADPEASPKVQQARSAYEVARDSAGDDADIYDHLYRFFERYYDQGDFMSRRYYARETNDRAAPYSVPYDGSEVYLHWANKDQYYIKTSESFNNYSIDISKASDNNGALFTAPGEAAPRKLHFKLVEADEGEHNNVKAATDKDRFFLLDAVPIVWQAGEDGASELVVRFQYCVDPDKTGNTSTWRDKRNAQAVTMILAALQEQAQSGDAQAGDAAAFHLVLAQLVAKGAKKAGGKQETQLLLAKYLYQYTAKNTMDYFIHKDLGGFLKREFDFYIKNEVMRLDDLGTANAPHIANLEKYLVKLHTLRTIGQKLIVFLAQIEEFQKKLWLKKKFVIDTQWLVTLDKVPAAMHTEVAANAAQWSHWKQLGFLTAPAQDLLVTAETGTLEYLQKNTALVLDTQFFDADFTARLLASIDNLDDATDGVLVHSENFQALNLMQERYREQVKCIYIDPPYNTTDNAIPYKNTFKHSSWMSLIQNRCEIGRKLNRKDGSILFAIDDTELANFRLLLNQIYGLSNYISTIPVEVNPAGQNIRENEPAKSHDYFHVYAKNVAHSSINLRGLTEDEKLSFNLTDNIGSFLWDNLRRRGGNSRPVDRPNQWYPLYVTINPPKVSLEDFNGATKVWPLDPHGERRIWRVSPDGARKDILLENISVLEKAGRIEVVKKSRIPEGRKPKTMWYGGAYSGTTYGSKLLKDILGTTEFSYPKSVNLVENALIYWADKNSLILDFFAGSGTTGHAVISQNKKDGGSRKYLLIEMGNYFETVLKARISKIIFASDWKNGKCIGNDGVSQIVKVIRLESYEDTLNNLQLADAGQRQQATAGYPQLREDYFLNYMLALETEGSPSLLNVATFADPTAYRLDVKRPGSDAHASSTVDLIETFNWLIGLRVDKLHAPQTFAAEMEQEADGDLPAGSATRLLVKGKLKEVVISAEIPSWWFRSVEGRVPGAAGSLIEQRVLVVWRKLSGNLEQDNAVLDAYLREVLRLNLSSNEDKNQFDVIYVNGSHTLPKLPHCDIRLLEQTFHQRMWESQDV